MKLLVIGLVIALPFVNARARDEDDDDGFAGNDDDQDDNNAQEVVDTAGPQRPADTQLLQKPAIPPPINPAPANAVQAAAPAAAAPQPTKEEVKTHAHNAKEAAKVARQAAVVANKVATHSVKVTHHAKKALSHALGALHDARVDSAGLDKRQKDTLKKAEAHLRAATKTAEHGELKKIKSEQDLQREKMEADLKRRGGLSEREQMRQEIQELRKKLKEKNIEDKDIFDALDALEKDLKNSSGPINDESKAELERLRNLVDSLEPAPAKVNKTAATEESHEESAEVAQPVIQKGLDIDTEMPYGDLEPFGREDTAQELTESSIRESDAMVDQLERAEVAEEKRSVFRALTRLRGAAITSFDGVARSQTGNIDEYNKIHQWRNTHPLHHLADEESDVSKWAFPDNAD